MEQGSFGTTLKAHRKARDLTQEALAELVGCSSDAICKWEANRFRPSKEMANRLADQFGLAPDSAERAAFVQLARMTAVSTSSAAQHSAAISPAANNLPCATTPFFGRETELAQIRTRLADPSCRLLNLTGPGGIGKTRLGLHAAQQHADETHERVCVLDLTACQRADQFVAALAQELHLQPAEHQDPLDQIVSALQHQRLLLVLDNGEAMPEDGNVIATLLERVAGLRVLVMSRVRLQFWHEQVLDVYGLEYPSGPVDAPARDTLMAYSAVQLFLHAARRVAPTFAPAAADLRAIVQLCQLVDGMPLALELAATWMRALTCGEIAQQLEQPADLLTTSWRELPPRHRSLHAACETSWRMLAPQAQAAFRSLGVFHGSFDASAAEHVAETALPILVQLIDASLVRREPSGRFALHPLIRHYAEIQLRAFPAHDMCVRNRYAAYYSVLLREHARLLAQAAEHGQPVDAILAELRHEVEHLRAVWQQLRTAETLLSCNDVTQFVDGMWLFYYRQGWYQEALTCLQQALDWERAHGSPQSASHDAVRAARWRRFAAQAATALGQLGLSRTYLDQAATLLGQRVPATRAGMLLASLGRYARHRMFGRWQALHVSTEAHREAALVHEQLGQVAYFQNQKLAALYASLTMLGKAERVGPSPELARAYATMCMMATVAGRHPLAAQYYRRAHATTEHAQHAAETAHVQYFTALHDISRGRWTQAQAALERVAYHYECGGDWRRWGESVASLQCLAFLQGRFAHAMQGWADLESSAARHGTAIPQLWGKLGQGACLLHLGQLHAACILLEDVREQLADMPLPPAHITVSGLLALAYWRSAEHERALEMVDSVERVAASSSVMMFTCLLGYMGCCRSGACRNR